MVTQMTNEKKELIKNFKAVVEDLLDNYEKYTEEEKAQIKEIFQRVSELNKLLDKYDDEKKRDFTEYLNSFSRYFYASR